SGGQFTPKLVVNLHWNGVVNLTGFSTQQGEFKEFPLAGFGAINYIKRTITADEFKRDLKIQLNYDGYANATIDTSQGIENLNIEI
ncbi:hypothetical protein, partial [Flavobacterium laiguense]